MLKIVCASLLVLASLSYADSTACSTPAAVSGATKTYAEKPAAAPKAAKNIFTGSWKANDGTMLITFSGTDSLKVSDAKGATKTVSSGTYTKNDSTFTATLNNNDIVLKMTFLYKVKDKKTVAAMITDFLVDGEKTESPKKWMSMTRIPVSSK